MNKRLYRFFWDKDRAGYVEGLFIAEQEEVNKAIGQHVSFGEILGKHSEVSGILKRRNLTMIVVSDLVIAELINAFEGTNISGYNPLNFIVTDNDDDSDEE